ncbi:hypothetical protein EON64_14245 [archaeon]|nr:MAG: hypothetical protein EON64_14245 [archaeon]
MILTNAQDKKQLAMVRTGYAALQEKIRANEVDGGVLAKLGVFMEHMANRNFPGASAVQTDLANTAWSEHKEWVKGLKNLIQLASRK